MELDEQRLFNLREKNYLYSLFDGKCASCGCELPDNWEADHVLPHSLGGPTKLSNGQPLCPPCHHIKSSTDRLMFNLVPPTKTNPVNSSKTIELRSWQIEALQEFSDHYATNRYTRDSDVRDKTFAVDAVPGAGKTIFCAALADMLLKAGAIDHVICVTPSLNLKGNIARSMRDTFRLDLWYDRLDLPASKRSGKHGQVVTYQSLRSEVEIELLLTNWAAAGDRYLLIVDEPHHGSIEENRRWGESVQGLLQHADFACLVSGTFWRTDGHKIPGARYELTDAATGSGHVGANYTYTLKRATEDGVISPVIFHSRSGGIDLVDPANDIKTNYIIDKDQKDEFGNSSIDSQAYHKLISGESEWTKSLLTEAHEELMDKRDEHHTNYGDFDKRNPPPLGLCVCYSIQHAKNIQNELEEITGVRPVLVTSEDRSSVSELENLKKSDDQWVVAVNMISEGVDIPRIKVLCFLTNVRTEMGFHQIIGRTMRVRDDVNGKPIGEEALIFVPEDPDLFEYVVTFINAVGVPARLDPPPKEERKPRGEGPDRIRPDHYIASTQVLRMTDIYNGVRMTDRNVFTALRQILPEKTPQQIQEIVSVASSFATSYVDKN